MQRIIAFFLTAHLILVAARASANSEPTGYDARSIGLGLTGVAYLKRPAAVAVNPANLAGIERGAFSLAFTPLLITQSAPVHGQPPLASVDAPVAFGPLGSIFGAARVHERVVLGVGAYIEQGYGSTFPNIAMLDGRPVPELTGGEMATADLSVIFFQVETALAASFEILPNLSVGLALRLPFVRQDADLVQSLPIGSQYARVENSFFGVGNPFAPSPAIKLGVTYEPTKQVALAFVYRSRAEVPLHGTARVHSSSLAGLDPAGDPNFLQIDATSRWITPHVLHMGVAFRTKNQRWLFPFEYRLQFHKSANERQEIEGTLPIGPGAPISLDANFYWKNAHSARFGAEHHFPKGVALRLGVNLANSAATPRGAQYFTPPPGFNSGGFLGVGYRYKDVAFDFAGGLAGGSSTIEHHPEECGPTANVKTGCGGDYAVLSHWLSLQMTWQPESL